MPEACTYSQHYREGPGDSRSEVIPTGQIERNSASHRRNNYCDTNHFARHDWLKRAKFNLSARHVDAHLYRVTAGNIRPLGERPLSTLLGISEGPLGGARRSRSGKSGPPPT